VAAAVVAAAAAVAADGGGKHGKRIKEHCDEINVDE
jgi:hypothetical protein